MYRAATIHCHYEGDIDNIANIAFTSGKDYCGLIASNSASMHVVYVHGKHSDAVRVYSALKANGIKIVYTEGV